MIVDHISNWRAYPLGEAWEKAFSFLEKLSSDSEDGQYPIDGDGLFARVMQYRTREESSPEAILEAHRRFVDVQMAMVGEERIGVYPSGMLVVKDAYDRDRDVEFFKYERSAPIQIGLEPGVFACLLPQDAHMPQLPLGPVGANVKKVVVKIAVERLALSLEAKRLF